MPKSKASAFLSVLLVFLSGAAVGGLSYRLYAEKAAPAAPPPAKKLRPEEVRKRVITHMKDAIKLDDQQVGQLQRIMDETRDAWTQVHQRADAEMQPIKKRADAERDKIHQAQVAKIRAILRPEQQPLYDKWEADRTAEFQRRQQRNNDDRKIRPDGR